MSNDWGMGVIDSLVQEIEASWRELAASVRDLSPEMRVRPGTVGDWSVKEVIAHIAAWEAEAARRIDVIISGFGAELTWPTREEEDAFNAAAAAAACEAEFEAVEKKLEEAHRDFTELLYAFGEEILATPLDVPATDWIPGWTYLHYQEHAPQIRALKALVG